MTDACVRYVGKEETLQTLQGRARPQERGSDGGYVNERECWISPGGIPSGPAKDPMSKEKKKEFLWTDDSSA